MNVIEDIRDIFSILHDGSITAWTGDNDWLTLTIKCDYLAERIDKSYTKFYVDLYKIKQLEFHPWPNPADLPAIIKTDFTDIFKAELDILSAEIKEDVVIVTCNQTDTDFDYCGGHLAISCETIKISDQSENELMIDQLDAICKSYWNELGKQ